MAQAQSHLSASSLSVEQVAGAINGMIAERAAAGWLVTAEGRKAKSRELGEPVSGTKAEVAKRVKAKAPDVIVFDDILGLFRAMVERDGLEVLKADAMAEVRAAADNIRLNP